MQYLYQQLTSSDVGLFKGLLEVFAEAFEDHETYQAAVPSNTYLQNLLEKPHFIVLAALSDNQIVGGLVAYELEKFEQDRRELYIYDLAVSTNHRRKGIATELINTLKRVARKRGAYVIFVQADQDDMPAIGLYESLGKKEDVHHFDIDPSA